MATILCHIRVRAGRESAFEEIARALHTATHENETAVRHYEYWRSAEERLYYALLAFDDFHGFLAHQTSDHHESASPALGELIEDIRLEWVDPVAGASRLPATSSQPLPEDAPELWQRYAKLFGVQSAAWWTPLRDAGT